MNVRLRDMLESDIADYVRWFTAETEWLRWDAPGEVFDTTEDAERAAWADYYAMVKDAPANAIRPKYEVEADGVHLGWVSRYDVDGVPAVGIDLPEVSHWGQGCGTKALRLFLGDMKEQGVSTVLAETWSGNVRMLRVLEKLGFEELRRETGSISVDGCAYDALTFHKEL